MSSTGSAGSSKSTGGVLDEMKDAFNYMKQELFGDSGASANASSGGGRRYMLNFDLNGRLRSILWFWMGFYVFMVLDVALATGFMGYPIARFLTYFFQYYWFVRVMGLRNVMKLITLLLLISAPLSRNPCISLTCVVLMMYC